MIHYLLLPGKRYIEFPFWCLVRLFYETVKDYDLPPDHGAEKRSSNSFFCLGSPKDILGIFEANGITGNPVICRDAVFMLSPLSFAYALNQFRPVVSSVFAC